MGTAKKTTAEPKPAQTGGANRAAKTTTASATSIKPGSFLDRRGGMVPTVRLGKRASKKTV